MVVTFQPAKPASGGTSIEVGLAAGAGKAAATWYFLPWGLVDAQDQHVLGQPAWSPHGGGDALAPGTSCPAGTLPP